MTMVHHSQSLPRSESTCIAPGVFPSNIPAASNKPCGAAEAAGVNCPLEGGVTSVLFTGVTRPPFPENVVVFRLLEVSSTMGVNERFAFPPMEFRRETTGEVSPDVLLEPFFATEFLRAEVRVGAVSVVGVAVLPPPRLRFLMTSVLSDRGRTTPCNLRNNPHALHRGWPSGFLRHRGVFVV